MRTRSAKDIEISPPAKRVKREALEPLRGGWNTLPHNLGASTTSPTKEDDDAELPDTPVPATRKRKRPEPAKTAQITPPATPARSLRARKPKMTKDSPETPTAKLEVHTTPLSEQPKPAKRAPKKTKANPYGLTPGQSPFPDWPDPSVEACQQVHDLLSKLHGVCKAPAQVPAPSLEVSGCGEVPSVLDALIRTLLSAATTSNNSNMAFQGLLKRYGILKTGIGKGSVDWNAVRESPLTDVIEAIKRGGLAKVKGQKIKTILDMVYQENQTRRRAYLAADSSDEKIDIVGGTETKTRGQRDLEILKTEQSVLSLDHLHGLPAPEVMQELTKYPGIGVKTASCVILFCLRQPSFAVDTHVFRLCKWLGWVPPTATRDQTFSHLEVRVPDGLKYALHQLLIRHGKTCPRCRAITSQGTAEWDRAECPIETLVERVGKRVSKQTVITTKRVVVKKKKKKEEEDSDESDESELSSLGDMSE